ALLREALHPLCDFARRLPPLRGHERAGPCAAIEAGEEHDVAPAGKAVIGDALAQVLRRGTGARHAKERPECFTGLTIGREQQGDCCPAPTQTSARRRAPATERWAPSMRRAPSTVHR